MKRQSAWRSAACVSILLVCAANRAAVGPEPEDLLLAQVTNTMAYQRLLWSVQQRAYPLGFVPEGARLRALHQTTTAQARRSAAAAAAQADQSEMWINIGPAPILNGQITPRGPVSGRVADIAVDPGDSNHWLIGAAQGGIWETTDAGATWTSRTDDQASLAMGAIAFAPGNPRIVYAGTGEGVFRSDAYAGMGLLKSTNGGRSWVSVATNPFGHNSFSDLKVHPADPEVLVVATVRGIAGRMATRIATTNDVPPAASARGLYKSVDAGVKWTLKLAGEATDLEVDPGDFNRQYAGIGEIVGDAANGVYRSRNAGESWQRIPGPWSASPEGVGRVELALAPSNPDMLYVSLAKPLTSGAGGLLGLWRATNAWADTPAWMALPSPNPARVGNSFWYYHELIVHPTIPNLLYLGEIAVWRFDGTTWTEVAGGYNPSFYGVTIHSDQHSFAWAGHHLVVGNDGGVWSTPDGGTTWSNHNRNLAITQFYDGSVHPTNPDFALGGSQDNGTELWTGASGWPWVLGGDGAASGIASRRGNTSWAMSTQWLDIYRTTNAGASITSADAGINDNSDDGANNRAPFIARFEICPRHDDMVIAGTDNLWKCTNFFSSPSATWSANSPEMNAAVTALAFAPADLSGNTYAFGLATGGLFLTTNGGAGWINLDPTNAVPDRYVTDLAFDPQASRTLLVTLSGFDEGTTNQPGHLFMTTNSAMPFPLWRNLSPPVNLPHNTVALDPADPTLLYVGTDMGIWKSSDQGGSWTHSGPESGMPNVAVFDLKISKVNGRPVAFTHGRGAFVQVATAPNSIDCGLVVTNAITRPTQTMAYTLDAAVGDRLRLQFAALATNSGSFTPLVSIVGAGFSASSDSGDLEVILPQTGPFIVNVAARNREGTGAFGLSWHRLDDPCVRLVSARFANHQFRFSVGPPSNLSCVVEANTNLTRGGWVSLATNVTPFTFTDAQASNYPARFYRVQRKP